MGQVTITRTKDRVGVGYDRTINVGNYESVKISTHYSSDVKKDESVKEAFDRVEHECAEQLNAFVEPIEEQLAKKPTKGSK